MEKDNSNRFIGHWLAVEVYMADDYDQVLMIADKYPQRSIGDEKVDWEKLVTELQVESSRFTKYNEELRDILQFYFTNNEDELKTWLNTTNKKAMKQFVEAVTNVS